MKKPLSLVYIVWCDAITNHASWLSAEEAIEWAETDNWINEHVGFLIKETSKYLLIAGERNLNMDEPQYGHVTKIPKTWIKKRINLTKHIK